MIHVVAVTLVMALSVFVPEATVTISTGSCTTGATPFTAYVAKLASAIVSCVALTQAAERATFEMRSSSTFPGKLRVSPAWKFPRCRFASPALIFLTSVVPVEAAAPPL